MMGINRAAILTGLAALAFSVGAHAQERAVPPLMEAINKNQADRVAALLAEGANANACHADTALVDMIDQEPRHLNLEVIKLLINAKGINLNAYSVRPMGDGSWSRTALIAAANKGHTEVVRLLLAKGAKTDLVDRHLPEVAELGAMPLNTALHYAAMNRFPEVVELLLAKGAAVEKLNSTGVTPLIAAAGSCDRKSPDKDRQDAVKVLTLLLDRGAKVDFCPMSPNVKYLKVDLPAGAPATVNPNVVVRGGGGTSALMAAASNRFLDGAKLLLDRGANLELKNYGTKLTPLLLATMARQTDMVAYLLDRGANLKVLDTVGQNALHLASTLLSYDLVELLLKRGIDIQSSVQANGRNALILALDQVGPDLEKPSLKVATYLLDKGIDVNFQGTGGHTALMSASGWGILTKNTARAKLVLERGAKVDTQDQQGETALMFAAGRGYVDIAKVLLDKGANLEIRNNEGRTALMIAAAATRDLKDDNGDFVDMVKLLLKRGADIHAKDKKNDNALSLAQRNGHKDASKLLISKGAKVEADIIQDQAGKAIVGIWEGRHNSLPDEIHRFVFNSDNTYTYEVRLSAQALKKTPANLRKGYAEAMSDQTKNQGSKGTYSFREQWLVLKTNSWFSPDRVLAWKVEKGKLMLNGMEFILSRVSK